MNNTFLPSFHINTNPSDKLKREWCMKVVNYYYFNTQNYSLLWDKNIKDIEGYASGEFDLAPYKKIFRSEDRRLRKNTDPNSLQNGRTAIGIDYTCLPLLGEKLNSAVAIIQKIPIEISCTATDALAIEKKQSDVNFLKNKPAVEADIQNVADRLNLGKVDLGSTKNSSVDFSDSPFGLDLSNPDELDIFVNLIYSLKIETAFETALEHFKDLKKINQLKLLEIKDQFKYAISVHEAFQNDLTGLPDAGYIYPDEMRTPYSQLPDFSDNTHRIRDARLTPMQLFDRFGSEIGSKEELAVIINDSKWGYCACNGIATVHPNNFDTFKINLKYIEVKSVDWVGVKSKKKSKKGFRSFTTNPDEATEKIWAQNTYCFWWLQNTDKIFDIKRLPYAHRTKGKETFQNFSTNIYKSQERSAVEQSIGENKKAQIADIKLQHTLIMSKPNGGVFDIRFIRGALDSLKDETNDWTIEKLLTLAWEQNIILGDTEGFDGKNDGQFKWFQEIKGGLGNEIIGYMNIIQAANINISRITGVNQQLTGASANEDGLVGLQKLLINASINALYYCNEAITAQYQSLFTIWANCIKEAIEGGGKPKEAIVQVIGSKKVNIIDGLDDTALHDIGVTIQIKQREEERQAFRNEMTRLKQLGVISAADEFLISNISNPKDAFAVLAVKEQQFKKQQDEIRQEQYANQQQIVQKQGENMVAVTEKETEGDIKKVYAKGEVDARITQLAAQLGMNEIQLQGYLKRQLQIDRNKAQTQKNIDTLTAKNNLQNQSAIPA